MGWAIKQIALPLRLDHQYSFDNYFGPHADFVINRLQTLISGTGEIQLGLWGQSSSGKTHLLNASAAFARAQQVKLHLYDARDLRVHSAVEFPGFEHGDVLAIDNLDAIAGLLDWEKCFYQIVNRCRHGELKLLYSLSGNPDLTEFELDDLRSRLQWGLLVQLPPNNDDDVRRILGYRARLLGFDLSSDVIAYLMTHHPRNLAAQMAILQTLDRASLARQRRITIPLVKQALEEQAGDR